ncbi:MAG: xanthine dehydrogenase family protein subunit M [Firmicutes bacterium]|nr:xanthine dehydrogenase family protein subunit M [Bacillota bacterium]
MDQQYLAPSTLKQATDYLCQHKAATVLAGGTDLLVRHYDDLDLLETIVDIGNLTELQTLETGSEVRLGALVSHYQLATDRWLNEHVSLLPRAATEVGAPQIRHRGTLGGNLANASPAADLAPPLIALDAVVELVSADGNRELPLADFFTGPGATKLAAGELITAVRFTKPGPNQGGSFIKLGKRKALAIATASIAVLVTVQGNILADVRICLGSVAPVPLRARNTEAVLRGQAVNALPLEAAQACLQTEISPIDDIRGTASYRRETAAAILVHALEQAITEARGES